MKAITKNKGFTLIELMIALVLGLVVSAIALQLFLTSQKSVTVQQGMMNLQNSTLFALGGMVDSIRLANLNASEPYVNDQVLYGGVVLSANNISNNVDADGALNFTIDDTLLSRGALGPSNLDQQNSDQLVIQYRVSTPNQFDCQGMELTANDYVVERYYVDEDVSRNDPNAPLALYCKAARYTEATAKTNTSLDALTATENDKAIVVIPRVDHFSVRFGVAYDGANALCSSIIQTKKIDDKDVTTTIEPDSKLDCFSYMNIEDYRDLDGAKPQIVSVQLGVLVRSTDSTGTNKFFDKDHLYNVLNVNSKLTENDRNSSYLRSVVTQTIALRNGFGVE